MTMRNSHENDDEEQSHLNNTISTCTVHRIKKQRSKSPTSSNYNSRSKMNTPFNIVLISAASVLLLGLSSPIVTATSSAQLNKKKNSNPAFSRLSGTSSLSSVAVAVGTGGIGSSSRCITAFSFPNSRTTTRNQNHIHRSNPSSSTGGGWYPLSHNLPTIPTTTAATTYSSSFTFLAASSEKDITTEKVKLGVRRRVRTILERAKSRTGIRNNSEDFLYNDDDNMNEQTYTQSKNGKYDYSLNGNTATSSNSQQAADKEQVSNGYDVWMSVSNEFDKDNTAAATTTSTTSSSSSNYKKIKTTSSVKTVVADAAAIGGLGAVLVDEETGKIDVALDYEPVEADDEEDDGEEQLNGSKTSSTLNQVNSTEAINGSSATTVTTTKATTSSPPTTTKKTRTKKTSPASTYSKPINAPKPSLDDSLLPASSKKSKSTRAKSTAELDAFKGDVSAAFSMPPPPLPFTLPKLNTQQKNQLARGERVQFQSDMGREGSGFVVLDVKAPSNVVWECLLDFYSYPTTIPTVREIQMFTNTHLNQDYYSEKEVDRKLYEDGTYATLKHGVRSVTRAAFTLSKFRLTIAAIHKYRPHPQGDYMVFTLDPACTNLVLKNAKGVWHTQSNPDGMGEDYTRVWLLCELKVSKLLPKWITDYAAERAMPRATTWIKPTCEAASELWLNDLED